MYYHFTHISTYSELQNFKLFVFYNFCTNLKVLLRFSFKINYQYTFINIWYSCLKINKICIEIYSLRPIRDVIFLLFYITHMFKNCNVSNETKIVYNKHHILYLVKTLQIFYKEIFVICYKRNGWGSYQALKVWNDIIIGKYVQDRNNTL